MFYLRNAPATYDFTLRLSRTYPRAESSTITLLTSWHLRTAFIKSTFTLRLVATNSRVFYQPHQCVCTLPLSQAPSHLASLQLTFALTSPNHLFTLSHYNLLSHGVADRMSRLRKMRLTTTYHRIVFTDSTSLELVPQGLPA